MTFVTNAALALALTATGAMAQTNTYDSGKYIELHLILGHDVSSKFGRANVEYDAILCKVKTTAACAKEAYEFLDAVIQNDNASPTVQRPLVVNHDDGTASVYYQGRAINVASKSDVSSAVCELKKDDARCV